MPNQERREREAEEAESRVRLAGEEARRLAMANYEVEKTDTDEAIERKRKKAMLQKEKEIVACAKFKSLKEYEKHERGITLDMMMSYLHCISGCVGVGMTGKYITADVEDETEMILELNMLEDEREANDMLAVEEEIRTREEKKLLLMIREEEEDALLYTVASNVEEEIEKQRQAVISLLVDESRQEEKERESLLCVLKNENMEEDFEKQQLMSVFLAEIRFEVTEDDEEEIRKEREEMMYEEVAAYEKMMERREIENCEIHLEEEEEERIMSLMMTDAEKEWNIYVYKDNTTI